MAARGRVAAIAVAMALAIIALVGFSWTSTARAGTYPPSQGCAMSFLPVSGSTIEPGEQLTIVGSGYTPSSTLQLSLHSGGVSLGSVHTSAQGSFRTVVTIPAGLTGSHHEIEASQASRTCTFGIVFGSDSDATTVDAPPASSSGDSQHGLAYTGFAALTASAIALALIAGGTLFVLIGRRRA